MVNLIYVKFNNLYDIYIYMIFNVRALITVLSWRQMLKSGKQLKCIGPLERLVSMVPNRLSSNLM